MSRVVKVHNHTFIVPKNPKEADAFMGAWIKAQNKAITKVTDIFLKDNDFSEEDFDLKVDEWSRDQKNNFKKIIAEAEKSI